MRELTLPADIKNIGNNIKTSMMSEGDHVLKNLNLQGGSAHALIFSWACWSGIWPRLDARLRRLAGPNWSPTPKKKSGFPFSFDFS